MIGVIVWSSEEREKAVIWCEDHASLAYLQGRDNLQNKAVWPGPGDLVELECEVTSTLRHARHVSMVSEQGCPGLPAMLQARGDAPREPHLRLVATGNPDTSDLQDLQTAAPTLRVGAAR